MPLKDDSLKDISKTSGFTPKSSKGIGKSDNTKYKKGGKLDKDGTLISSTQSNPIPVVVLEGAPVASFIVSEQMSLGKQVYVIQAEENNGVVTKVYLARNDDAGVLTGIDWCDAQYVICGLLADQKVDINQNNPVQGEPETTATIDESENDGILESFVFFDPYFSNTGPTGNQTQEEWEASYRYNLELGIGFQREIAKFMNLYDGRGTISKKKQKEIDKYIHLVPFSNVLPEFIEIYPEYKSNPNPNINGDQAQFYNYWNANVAIKKVNVIVLHNHAGADGLSILEAGTTVVKMWDINGNMTIPKIDYVLLLGCNMGNIDFRPNFASTFADLSQGGNTTEQEQVYPTAVIAADGSTYTGAILNKKKFVIGAETKMSKYTDSHHQDHTNSVGFCIYKKGMGKAELPISIEGTQATPKEEGSSKDWTLNPITIEKLLKEAEKIRTKWES